MMMTVNYVRRVHQGVEIIDHGYARRANVLGHIAQVCTVGDWFMAAIKQAYRQVADVQLGPGAVRESVISD